MSIGGAFEKETPRLITALATLRDNCSQPLGRNRRSVLDAAMGDPAKRRFAFLMMRVALSQVLGQSGNLGGRAKGQGLSR